MAVSCDPTPKCKHCGLPLGAAEQEFCCAGCRAVFNFLQTHNLESFYIYREKGGAWSTKPIAAHGSRFDYMDDALFAERYIQAAPSGLSEITFYIEGMHCSACVWLLEKAPQLTDGLIEVRVNLPRSCVYAYFNGSKARPSQIAALIESLGYQPHALAPDASQSSVRRADRMFLWRLGVAAFFAANIMLIATSRYQGLFSGIEHRFDQFFVWVSCLMCLPVVTFSAWPFYRTAWAGLRVRKLHIDLPLAIAMIGAFVPSAINTLRGSGEVYFDSVSALIFLLLCGRLLQQRAIRRAAEQGELLHALTPQYAVLREAETDRQVFVESLVNGQNVAVRAGEIFPVDGSVSQGNSSVNAAILSGESRAVAVRPGDKVFAGTRNLTADVVVQVERSGHASRLGRLMQMIEQASARKSATVEFTDRLSAYFVAGVLVLAACTFGYWLQDGWQSAIDKVIALLVVSCPCALGIATPITFSLALAKAARRGIVIKNPAAIERTCAAKRVFFDKTGTLTTGATSVVAFIPLRFDEQHLRSVCLSIEAQSSHPLALALCEYCAGAEKLELAQWRESEGRGAEALIDGRRWRVGSFTWLSQAGVRLDAENLSVTSRLVADGATPVLLACDDQLAAIAGISDQIRPEASKVISALEKEGLHSELLSGDLRELAQRVARQVGISHEAVHAPLSPEQKAEYVTQASSRGDVIMVGDGMNDAVALKQAGVSIAVRGGAEIALQVSDLFLADADLSKIPEFVHGSKRVRRLVQKALFISLIYNLSASLLAVFGLVGPLFAALLMPLSSISVIALVMSSRTFES